MEAGFSWDWDVASCGATGCREWLPFLITITILAYSGLAAVWCGVSDQCLGQPLLAGGHFRCKSTPNSDTSEGEAAAQRSALFTDDHEQLAPQTPAATMSRRGCRAAISPPCRPPLFRVPLPLGMCFAWKRQCPRRRAAMHQARRTPARGSRHGSRHGLDLHVVRPGLAIIHSVIPSGSRIGSLALLRSIWEHSARRRQKPSPDAAAAFEYGDGSRVFDDAADQRIKGVTRAR